jgi:hypothetical protein
VDGGGEKRGPDVQDVHNGLGSMLDNGLTQAEGFEVLTHLCEQDEH